jgi:hypothetical protein
MTGFSRWDHSLEYGYLSRAIQGLKAHGLLVGDNLLEHLSLLGWEHSNLTGDYVRRQNWQVKSGKKCDICNSTFTIQTTSDRTLR